MTDAPPRAKKSILRATLLVLPAHVVFGAGNAFLPILLSTFFGRSDATDVYQFAWAVFGFAGSLVFSAYQDSAIVPILAEERLAHRKALPELLGALLAHTWVIGGAIAIAVGAIAMGWFSLRYHGDQFRLAATMVLPFCLFLVTMATRTFFATLLAAEHHFFVQPIANGLGMVVNLGMLTLGHERFGVALIPTSALAGELVAALLLAWYALRIVRIELRLGFTRPEPLRKFARLIASEVGGGAVTRVNPVVDQLMAGLSGVVGAGTMLRYSGDVATLPTSILQAALLPVLLSHLSDDFAARDIAKFRATVVKALITVCLLMLGAAVVLYAVRGPLIRLVFLHGEMDAGGVDRMIAILPFHLVGLIPFGALLVLARAHVALKNSTIMLGMGIFNATCNAVFNVVLLRAIGLEGVALSTSSVYLAVAILFWFRFEARLAAIRALPMGTA